jgi:hypothetical protein
MKGSVDRRQAEGIEPGRGLRRSRPGLIGSKNERGECASRKGSDEVCNFLLGEGAHRFSAAENAKHGLGEGDFRQRLIIGRFKHRHEVVLAHHHKDLLQLRAPVPIGFLGGGNPIWQVLEILGRLITEAEQSYVGWHFWLPLALNVVRASPVSAETQCRKAIESNHRV